MRTQWVCHLFSPRRTAHRSPVASYSGCNVQNCPLLVSSPRVMFLSVLRTLNPWRMQLSRGRASLVVAYTIPCRCAYTEAWLQKKSTTMITKTWMMKHLEFTEHLQKLFKQTSEEIWNWFYFVPLRYKNIFYLVVQSYCSFVQQGWGSGGEESFFYCISSQN